MIRASAALDPAIDLALRIAKREAGPILWSLGLLPREQKHALALLYGFRSICRDAIQRAGSLDERLHMLDWLRQQIQQAPPRTDQDQPYPSLAAAVTVWHLLADSLELPPVLALELIHGFERMTELSKPGQRPATLEDLLRLAYFTAGAWARAVFHIVGDGPRTLSAAHRLAAEKLAVDTGIAVQLLLWTRSLYQDFHRGQSVVPTAWLHADPKVFRPEWARPVASKLLAACQAMIRSGRNDERLLPARFRFFAIAVRQLVLKHSARLSKGDVDLKSPPPLSPLLIADLVFSAGIESLGAWIFSAPKVTSTPVSDHTEDRPSTSPSPPSDASKSDRAAALD